MVNEKKLRTALRKYNYQAKLADNLYQKRKELDNNIDDAESNMVNKYAEVTKMLGLGEKDAEFVMDAMYDNKSNPEEQIRLLMERSESVLFT